MLNDDLSKQKKDKEKQLNRRRINEEDDEDVETYMYDVRKPMEFLNESSHGVFDISRQTGINSAASVFDRKATFRTHG